MTEGHGIDGNALGVAYGFTYFQVRLSGGRPGGRSMTTFRLADDVEHSDPKPILMQCDLDGNG